jgi:hypothetical protein
VSRRDRQEPRPRPKTELQLYRQRIHEEALERRDKLLERAEAQMTRRRDLRAAARAEALADARETVEQIAAHREATTRVEYHDPERSGIWSGLALGLGVASLIGVAGVLVYLLVRKKDGAVVGVQGLGYAPPIFIGNGGVSAELTGSLQSLASSLSPPQGQWTSSLVKSYRLPSLNDKTRGAIRVAQATDVPYEVSLRTVSPLNQSAVFSFSPNELNQSNGLPIGDNIILPAGHWQLMTLMPREVLYAKGTDATVVISVTMNQAPRRR